MLYFNSNDASVNKSSFEMLCSVLMGKFTNV